MGNDEIVKGINKTLDKIRPYLQYDGGDVLLSKFEDGVAYIRMSGACLDCMLMTDDFDEGISLLILDENKEVKDVVLESLSAENENTAEDNLTKSWSELLGDKLDGDSNDLRQN